MSKDYYTILKLPRDASHDTIRQTYRKEIRKVHPDVSDAPDLERILEVQKAYETLADPDKRKAYDRSLETAESRGSEHHRVSQPLRRPSTLPWLEVILTPEEAAGGVAFSLEVPARGPCPYCRGRIEGVLFLCPVCRGDGMVPQSRVVRFRIPAGTRDGERFRLLIDSTGEELLIAVTVQGRWR